MVRLDGVSMQRCKQVKGSCPDAVFSKSSQAEDVKEGVKTKVVSRKKASVLGLNPARGGCWIRL